MTLIAFPKLPITPAAITWASGATPAAQRIVIPNQCTSLYMFWCFWLDADGHGLLSAMLNGKSPKRTSEIVTVATNDWPANGVAFWPRPPLGSQELSVVWDAAPAEGPCCMIAFLQDGDLAGWRDVGHDQNNHAIPVSTTIKSSPGDMVLKFDQRYAGTLSLPGTSEGWTSLQTLFNNADNTRLSRCNATGAGQTICNSEDEYYSSITAISIPLTTRRQFKLRYEGGKHSRRMK